MPAWSALAEPSVVPASIVAARYCFGGTMVLELAREGAELRAFIGIHPWVNTPRRAAGFDLAGQEYDQRTDRRCRRAIGVHLADALT